MEREAWLSGKLQGFAPVMMPAAHALVECGKDLEKHAANLSDAELTMRPNNQPSVAFHLRHIAGSIDRLLTYARNEQLSHAQFAALQAETVTESTENALELVDQAIEKINQALNVLKTTPENVLFEERFVGRQKLPTNIFGLLFHIAEHTARHTGQIVTTAKIVRNQKSVD